MMLLTVDSARPQEASTRWADGLRRLFGPGISAAPAPRFQRGAVRQWPVGAARVLDVRSDGQSLVREAADDELGGDISIIFQLEGTAELRHQGRSVSLTEGNATLLDTSARSEIHMEGPYRQLLLLVPRSIVSVPRDCLARLFSPSDPVDGVLLDALRSLGGSEQLEPGQRRALLAAVLALLGGSSLTRHAEAPTHPRVRRALASIEAGFRDPALTARAIARGQGVSRRYLDALVAAHSMTLTALIRERRLQEAARLLVADSELSVLQLAVAVGFRSAPQLARAFRARFGCAPTDWRRGAREVAVGEAAGGERGAASGIAEG